jgi:HlyD family secretion protein
MFRKYILPFLALIGVGIGIFAALRDTKTIPPAQPVSKAPQPPYQAFVAGAGIVQASSENICIGTQIAGIISRLKATLKLRERTEPVQTRSDPNN